MTWRCTLVMMAAACGAPRPAQHPQAQDAPLSLAADHRMIAVPAGQFVAGSTPEERQAAYDDHAHSAGSDLARLERWFDREADRHLETLPAYRIDLMPVTQAQYAEFVAAGGAQPLVVDEAAWTAQGFGHDFATEVARFVWVDGRPPSGREDHPVVLVTWQDADRYCTWRGDLAGERRRLPSALEFEKAARGDGGIAYPWGNLFEPERLNSAVQGPRDTMPAGSFVAGASPYGALDMAGNVAQWTSTAADGGDDEVIVKGSAWPDFAGLGRGAAWQARARAARHVILGFRCAAEAS